MSFLPTDYTAPKTSGHYCKLQEGENKIRILSKPIIGWEDWVNQKPVRFRMDNKPAKSNDPKKPIKHFWSFIIWNHLEEQIQILHVTQASIRNAIEALSKDSDWGDPYYYDLKIAKKGEGMDTEYFVNPSPHKPIGDYVKEQFYERRINLEALFNNADPFSKENESWTEGVFDDKPQVTNSSDITEKQAHELKKLLDKCSPEYQVSVSETLLSLTGSDKIEDLSLSMYERIKTAAIKKSEEYQEQVLNEKFNEIGL